MLKINGKRALNLKKSKGSCCSVSIPVYNTRNHDITLKKGSILGTLETVQSVITGPRVKLASCKSALNPPVVCSADRFKAVVPELVLLLVALWLILRGDLLYVFPCVSLFLCFSVLLVLRLPRLGKRELILVLFVRLFGLCLFRFVGFLFLLGIGKGCGL